MMHYIKKVDERELWGSGKVELWDLSRCNTNEESRAECVSQIAGVCYGKEPKDKERLYERLQKENASTLEFIRTGLGGWGSSIDASLRNWGRNCLTHERIIQERHNWDVEDMEGLLCEHRANIATFRLTVPIFLARQIMRHRQFSYQERSLRFTKVGLDDAAWYIPPDVSMDVHNLFAEAYEKEIVIYTKLLEAGVPREQARAVLGVGLYTTLWMQGDVPAWKNYFLLRLGKHTQKEHRELAQAMLDLLEEHQPELWRKVRA